MRWHDLLSGNDPAQKKVLIIEDNPQLEELLTRAIRVIRPELQVDWAISAEEVLKHPGVENVALDQIYSLVIADIHLCGKLTGIGFWELCQQKYPSIAFILMSGVPSFELPSMLAPGAKPPLFLQKPFPVSAYKVAVSTVLQGGSSESGPQDASRKNAA